VAAHVVVSIFIVNNSRETIPFVFCNCRFGSRRSRARGRWRDIVAWVSFRKSAAGWQLSPFFWQTYPFVISWEIAGRGLVLAAKNPAQSPARAARVVLLNTRFWKIPVTRVKRIRWGELISRKTFDRSGAYRPLTTAKALALAARLGRFRRESGHPLNSEGVMV